jgi:hypothetical protein
VQLYGLNFGQPIKASFIWPFYCPNQIFLPACVLTRPSVMLMRVFSITLLPFSLAGGQWRAKYFRKSVYIVIVASSNC